MLEQFQLLAANQFAISSGKMQLAMLEHPFFSIGSRAKDMSIYKYESNDGQLDLMIKPSGAGRATIRDSDFIVYLMAKLVMMKELGQLDSDTPLITVEASEFLQFANRGDSGQSYKNLREMLDRLGGTTYTLTTKRENGRIQNIENTTWIDHEWKAVRELKNKELITFNVRPRAWWVKTIRESNDYLTVPKEFFSIPHDLHRRYWQIGRMHANKNKPFLISWEKFYNKVGSATDFVVFRSRLRKTIKDKGSVTVLGYVITETEDKRNLQIIEAPDKD